MIASVDTLPAPALVVIMLLMVFGGIVVLIGALGMVRLPNFYQRMHGPAVIATLGAGCLLLASLLRFLVAEGLTLPHELLVPVFIVMTAPISAMLITRTAVYRDLRAGQKDSSACTGRDHQVPHEEDQEAGRS